MLPTAIHILREIRRQPKFRRGKLCESLKSFWTNSGRRGIPPSGICFRLELRQFRPRRFPFRVCPGQAIVDFHQLTVDLRRPPACRVGLWLLQFRRQFLLARFQLRDFFFQRGDAFLDFLPLARTRLPLLGFNPFLPLA